MFVLAYAFLTTYQAYYLLEKLGSAEDDVPRQLFLATLGHVERGRGRLAARRVALGPDGRRKVFVGAASLVFGLAMFVIALASSFNGFVAGMALGGLGLRLVHGRRPGTGGRRAPRPGSAAKDLGVMNIAGALPSSVAPALAPAILAVGGGSYGVLYAVAGPAQSSAPARSAREARSLTAEKGPAGRRGREARVGAAPPVSPGEPTW